MGLSINNSNNQKRVVFSADLSAKKSRNVANSEENDAIAQLMNEASINIQAAHAATDFNNRFFHVEQARTNLEDVILIDPTNTSAWITKIDLLSRFARSEMQNLLVSAEEKCRSNVEVLNRVGQEYSLNDQWDRALKVYEKGAEQGNADSLYSCGAILKYHPKNTRDAIKANQYFTNAISGGSIPAKYEYAIHLMRSGAPDKEIKKGKRLLCEAAEGGHTVAINTYASLVAENGSREEKLKARALFESVLKFGHVQVMHNYALFLKNNTELFPETKENDLIKARSLFEKAYKRGDIEAGIELATMLEHGIGGPVLSENARRLYETLLPDDNARCRLNLANMLIDGRGGDIDVVRARHLLALNQDVYSRYLYAHLLLESEDNELKYEARAVLMEISDHYIPAKNDYASLLEEGVGGDKNEAGARVLYHDAYLNNDDNTYWCPVYSYALMLLEGRGGERLEEEARRLFQEGADKGFIKCIEKYVDILIGSIGGEKDFAQAKLYVEKAKQLNEHDSASQMHKKISAAEDEILRVKREEANRRAKAAIEEIEREAEARKKAILDQLNVELGMNVSRASLEDLAEVALQH